MYTKENSDVYQRKTSCILKKTLMYTKENPNVYPSCIKKTKENPHVYQRKF